MHHVISSTEGLQCHVKMHGAESYSVLLRSLACTGCMASCLLHRRRQKYSDPNGLHAGPSITSGSESFGMSRTVSLVHASTAAPASGIQQGQRELGSRHARSSPSQSVKPLPRVPGNVRVSTDLRAVRWDPNIPADGGVISRMPCSGYNQAKLAT